MTSSPLSQGESISLPRVADSWLRMLEGAVDVELDSSIPAIPPRLAYWDAAITPDSEWIKLPSCESPSVNSVIVRSASLAPLSETVTV